MFFKYTPPQERNMPYGEDPAADAAADHAAADAAAAAAGQVPKLEDQSTDPKDRKIAELTRVAAEGSAREAEYREEIAALKAEAASIREDAEAEVDHFKADAERLATEVKAHATEVIRLYGVIQEGVTTQVRLGATHFLDGIRAWAKAVEDAV